MCTEVVRQRDLYFHLDTGLFLDNISTKGQYISKQNCRALISPKKQMDEFVFLSWQSENTWNLKLIFVSKSPDLLQIYCREKAQYPSENIDFFTLLLLYTMESKYFYNIIETLFPSTMPLDIFTIYCNVCFIKIRSKHSNNIKLSYYKFLWNKRYLNRR